MISEKNGHDGQFPSAAEMMDYVQKLNGNIKTGPLEKGGWFVTGTSNESGGNNPTVTLSKKNPENPHNGLISEAVPWETFKSWQEQA